MSKTSITYLLFYFSFLIVVCVAVFFNKSCLIYIKPIVPVSLVILYIRHIKKFNFLFPLCMVAVLAVDVFIYLDFVKYLEIISLIVTVYYVGGVFLLKQYIFKEDITFGKLASPPVIIGVLLVIYLIITIVQLALPKITNSIGPIALIGIGAILFSSVNFIIYLADRYDKSIYLFTTACCTIFIDGLLAINEMYYFSKVFVVLNNIAEIAGLYFLTSFFIETKLLDKESSKKNYL